MCGLCDVLFGTDVVVHTRVPHARFAGPGVHIGAGLACPHVSHARLVPQVAYLGVVAASGPVLVAFKKRRVRVL